MRNTTDKIIDYCIDHGGIDLENIRDAMRPGLDRSETFADREAREAQERARSAAFRDPVQQGALRLTAKYPHVSLVDAQTIARAVQAEGGNGSPLDREVARRLHDGEGGHSALMAARAAVADGKSGSRATTLAEDALALQSIDPSEDLAACTRYALALRARGPGGMAGVQLRCRAGESLSSAVASMTRR
jgi:hypothetical protein